MSKLITLVAHLDRQRQALASLNSGSVPTRHAKNGTIDAYREYLKLEIERTSKRVEDLKLVTPGKK